MKNEMAHVFTAEDNFIPTFRMIPVMHRWHVSCAGTEESYIVNYEDVEAEEFPSEEPFPCC